MIQNLLNIDKNAGKKFDVILMNPPYDEKSNGDQFYVKFINKVLEIANKCVIISPDNAFLSKAKSKNKAFIQNINTYKPELTIEKWKGFDAFPNSRSCISVWNTNNPSNKIKVNDKYFDLQENIILNDSEYLQMFYNKLVKYFSNHESIYDKCVANPKNNQYFDPTGRNKIVNKWENENTWFTVFPYCIAAHFTTFTYEKYSDKLWNGPARILLPFDSEKYAKNCYLTIQNTTTAKIKKGNLNTFFKLISDILPKVGFIKSVDKYKYFPYLDFSKVYDTEDLFKLIGMEYNKEEIEKILNK